MRCPQCQGPLATWTRQRVSGKLQNAHCPACGWGTCEWSPLGLVYRIAEATGDPAQIAGAAAPLETEIADRTGAAAATIAAATTAHPNGLPGLYGYVQAFGHLPP